MKRPYTEAVRKVDSMLLTGRSNDLKVATYDAVALSDALSVFLLDEQIRPILEILDPKAVEQARRALLLEV